MQFGSFNRHHPTSQLLLFNGKTHKTIHHIPPSSKSKLNARYIHNFGMKLEYLSFLSGVFAPLLLPCSGFVPSSIPHGSLSNTRTLRLRSTISTTKLFVGSTADEEQKANQKTKGASFISNNPFISDCDNTNTPPSLAKIVSSIHSIKSGSDIRGIFTDHKSIGSILNVSNVSNERCLTPFAAYCYGAAFGQMVQIRSGKGVVTSSPSTSSRSLVSTNFDHWVDETSFLNEKSSQTIICVGRDPRHSGTRLSDSFCRGVESVQGVVARYTGLASTPAMFEFCRSDMCDGAVMVTASHLPEDRNGFKFFTKNGGLTKKDIEILAERASICARQWHDIGVVPPTSGKDGVYCSSWVGVCECSWSLV